CVAARRGPARLIPAMNLPRARYPLPLRERVAASVASGRVRGVWSRSPHPPRGFAARHPLPQGEGVLECAARSSLYLPSRSAVLVFLSLDARCVELGAKSRGLSGILRLAGGIARVDKGVHLIRIDDAAVRMIFEGFAFRERKHP